MRTRVLLSFEPLVHYGTADVILIDGIAANWVCKAVHSGMQQAPHLEHLITCMLLHRLASKDATLCCISCSRASAGDAPKRCSAGPVRLRSCIRIEASSLHSGASRIILMPHPLRWSGAMARSR